MEIFVLLLRLEIKKVFLFEKLLMTTAESAARLERSSFLRNEVEQKKREWKAEMSAQKKSIKRQAIADQRGKSLSNGEGTLATVRSATWV